ncbi:mas-related G-protein coupled receptor member D-like [Melanerpes formicivorus]|uniref:mas-related G-protein coupled receptor member D-like n=1 Tax=Melanerpes formicivorus TaxID=211600 RepID=UPI00358F5E7F
MEETITADPSLSSLTCGYVEDIKYNCSRIPSALMVFAAVCMGISGCGLVGNGLVVWFLGFHTKQNPFTTYILHLAIADFSLTLLFFLLMLATLSFTVVCLYHFFPFYKDFVFAVEFLCHFFDLSSLGLLTALSVERCLSVLFPSWYQSHRPKNCSGIVCGVLWALAGLFVSSMWLSSTFAGSYEMTFDGVDITISIIFSSVMLVSVLALSIKLRCGSQRRHPRKLSVTVLLNVTFFLFALAILFGVEVFQSVPISHELFPEVTSSLVAVLSSSIYPALYFLLGSCRQRRFQCSIRAAFQRLFEEEATSEERSQVPGDAVMETSV